MNLVGLLIMGPTEYHAGAWRHPESLTNYLNPVWPIQAAQSLERGCFDALFFADVAGLYDYHEGSPRSLLESGGQINMLDPVAVIAMLTQATRHLGLATTLSSSLHHPFQIARSLGTLDHLSGGRIAWNIVTSASRFEARNFGQDSLRPRDQRYDMADEVVEAAMALWGSWDPDALVLDKASGRFADAGKVRSTNYEGRFVKTAGPLTFPPPPQGHPVLMQAGSSPRGRAFAARWAEVIFTVQYSKAHMSAFVTDMRERLAAAGRDPDSCRILVGIDPIVGETDAIARERQAYLNALVQPDAGMGLLSAHLGTDLARFPEDQPVAEVIREEGSLGSLDRVRQGTASEGFTMREAARRYGTSGMAPQVVGTAGSVADQMQDFFEAGACDGFIVAPSVFPGTFESFSRSVVPELQRRGLFRKAYNGGTLRETMLGRKTSVLQAG